MRHTYIILYLGLEQKPFVQTQLIGIGQNGQKPQRFANLDNTINFNVHLQFGVHRLCRCAPTIVGEITRVLIYKIGVKNKVITFGEFIQRLIAAAH